MPLDGLMLRAITRELNEKLAGGRVEKVFQPERDEIDLAIRSVGGNYRLLMTSSPAAPRMHLTGDAKENPIKPPMMCMLLRKHLSSAKITGADQMGLERILNRNTPVGRKQQFNQLQHTAVYFHKSLLSFPDCYGHLYFY